MEPLFRIIKNCKPIIELTSNNYQLISERDRKVLLKTI